MRLSEYCLKSKPENRNRDDSASAAEPHLIATIVASTSTIRFVVFDRAGQLLTSQSAVSPTIISDDEGVCEIDPAAVLDIVTSCIKRGIHHLNETNCDVLALKALGVATQTSTVVLWNSKTGLPLCDAIGQMDTRAADTVAEFLAGKARGDRRHLQKLSGLPLSTLFSAAKLQWIVANVVGVKQAVREGTCMFGTLDSWLVWKLTGGPAGGVHVTDVTNAALTQLMNIRTLDWDDDLRAFWEIPTALVLPTILSCSEIAGNVATGPLKGLPVAGILGVQNASLLGQQCFNAGDAKITYGSGCNVLYNTGVKPVLSRHGLLTTIAFKLGCNEKVRYALEGPTAAAGETLDWLVNKLNIASSVGELDRLAASVASTNDLCFVPSFSGLYAPRWRDDSRGTIIGISSATDRRHIARAALESGCFQTREVLEACHNDTGLPLLSLKADGGVAVSDVAMQLQSDLLGVDVERSASSETIAWGAALAAGLALGVDTWSLDSLQEQVTVDVFRPRVSAADRDQRYSAWHRAVERSLNWSREAPPCRDVDDADESGRLSPLSVENVTVSFAVAAIGLVALSSAWIIALHRNR